MKPEPPVTKYFMAGNLGGPAQDGACPRPADAYDDPHDHARARPRRCHGRAACWRWPARSPSWPPRPTRTTAT